jgi:hypothetical protein
MTDDQIILLAEENLYCNVSVMDWSGKTEDILKFARVMYEKGYEKGCDEDPVGPTADEMTLRGLRAVLARWGAPAAVPTLATELEGSNV